MAVNRKDIIKEKNGKEFLQKEGKKFLSYIFLMK